MRSVPRLDKVRIENFKAIRNSGVLRLTPFTAIIGNNGSGKSSLIEALEFLYTATVRDLPSALERWRGFEHVWNKFSGPATPRRAAKPMSFILSGFLPHSGPGGAAFRAEMEIGYRKGGTEVGFLRQDNRIEAPGLLYVSDDENFPEARDDVRPLWAQSARLRQYVPAWQFLMLNPDDMGSPRQTAPARVRGLERDGRNIAAYLYDFQERYPSAFAEFVDAVRFVVPYLQDMRAEQSLDIVRTGFLTIIEGKEKIPGWLVSSGTLRVCAIMACLMHPEPPSLLVIEEVENGLDPRTLGMVTSAIQSAVESGRTQVIATTHSPSFLDNVPPEYIMTVVRAENGEPKFRRVDPEALGKWLEDFAPGRLYTMGVLTR